MTKTLTIISSQTTPALLADTTEYAGLYVEHPADYDPAAITHEDVVQDTLVTVLQLTAEETDGMLCVVDAEGGVWWPSDEAGAEIAASADPADCAIRMCHQSPMRGRWAA